MGTIKKKTKKPVKKLKKKVAKKLSAKDKEIVKLKAIIKKLKSKDEAVKSRDEAIKELTGAYRKQPVTITHVDRELVLNRAKCKSCGDVVISHSGHDYKSCKCGKIAVDGGTNYLRRSGEREDIEEMSLYSDSPFTEIRLAVCRGGRGKNGDQPLTWVPIAKMNDEWLEACIVYNVERGMGDTVSTKLYKQEQEYRKVHNIVIAE